MDISDRWRSDSEDSPVHYFRIIWGRKWVILVILVLAAGAALLYSLRQTPQYRATTEVLRDTAALDQTLFGTSVFQIEDPNFALDTGANLVRLTDVAQLVKADLHSTLSADALLGMVSVTPSSTTDLLTISAQSSQPTEAAAVANSFANQFIKYRQQANVSILAAADQQVVVELDRMSATELASARGTTLAQRHVELGVLESMQTGGFEVVQAATVPTSASSPRTKRNTAYGLVGGLILGLLLAVTLDNVDRRIKDDQTLETEFGLPVLARVPVVGRRWATRNSRHARAPVGFADLQSPFSESFRTLRSNLRFYQADQKTQALLISSALPQEGKTITAVNLAFSLALSGARVMLLEADLRRPMLHEYLALDNRVGVSSVLAGTGEFSESLQAVRVPDFIGGYETSGEGAPGKAALETRFLCMTSGPLPPNPAELLSSPRMRELVETASQYAEYVLIDTPPLLLASDALNLATYVDGIILAARMKHVTTDQAHDVRTMLGRSGARVLGLVANGLSTKRGGYYRGGYKGYYSRTPE